LLFTCYVLFIFFTFLFTSIFLSFFFFYRSVHHRDLHSFPTRRSSDLLFVFFMLTLVLANNYLLMFVGWEGVGLCSYLLIGAQAQDRKSTRLNSSHVAISYAVFCLKKKNKKQINIKHK